MDLVKIPKMSKTEYDALIKRQYIARIAYAGGEHP
jgi:nitroimidazol reductase NimA-like FMN-containing flavoprotein (pyridoxamine 5'-phosphate oxidase superfamily)